MSTEQFFELKPKKETVKMRLNPIKDKALVFRHGHIAVTDYRLGDNPDFEKSLSIWNEMTWKYERKAGYYIPELKEFRLPRGYDTGMLSKFFNHGYHVRVDNDSVYPADTIDIDLMTPPRDDEQRVGLSFLCCQGEFKKNARYTTLMLDMNTGSGKAQPDDTMIPTPDGIRRLDSLEVGDEVYNRYGKPVEILMIFPQKGKTLAYTVTFKDGRKTRCSIEHLWYVYNGYKFETLTLSEIIEGRNAGITYTVPDFTLPSCMKYKKANLQIVDITPWGYCKQRCILIDDPDHIYLTNDHIPTHNTYTSVAATCFMHARTVIIVPFSKLLEQWKESYLNFTSLKSDEILIVQGSKICKQIIEGKHKDVKVFIFLVDTIDAFNKAYGNLETIEMFRATNAYVKIVDEIHRDMKIISMIEALTNFRMTFYASASPGRTQRKENWIFKTCFMHIPKFGSGFKTKEEKHLNVLIKRYKFIPTPAQSGRMVHRQKKWLNSKSYEKELITSPLEQKQDFMNSIKSMLKWSKKLLKKGNKILILCETIDGTAFLQNVAEEIFPGDTGRYYGQMSQTEKDAALKKSIICATISSLGTGADVPGIQHVYNITTYTSQITATQTAGRGRKLKDGTLVFYIEFVNFSYTKTLRQYEKRKPNLIKISKTGKIMVID